MADKFGPYIQKLMTTILDKEQDPPPRLVNDLKLLGQIYPDLKIEFVVRKGSFGPRLIESLSSEFGIPPNSLSVLESLLYNLSGLFKQKPRYPLFLK